MIGHNNVKHVFYNDLSLDNFSGQLFPKKSEYSLLDIKLYRFSYHVHKSINGVNDLLVNAESCVGCKRL